MTIRIRVCERLGVLSVGTGVCLCFTWCGGESSYGVLRH